MPPLYAVCERLRRLAICSHNQMMQHLDYWCTLFAEWWRYVCACVICCATSGCYDIVRRSHPRSISQYRLIDMITRLGCQTLLTKLYSFKTVVGIKLMKIADRCCLCVATSITITFMDHRATLIEVNLAEYRYTFLHMSVVSILKNIFLFVI